MSDAPLAKRIGLDVVKSTTLSESVCQCCAKKVQTAVQLYDFIAADWTGTPSSSFRDQTPRSFLQVMNLEDLSAFFLLHFPPQSEVLNRRKAARQMAALKEP